ncbi:MAG: hypothetical protein JWM60_1003 [Solirubrobacterales bacterium]|nr:hypothetical protein [Solirubrobacterales bacterium]
MRLRLLLPRSRGGAGLSSLRPARPRAPRIAFAVRAGGPRLRRGAAALALVALAGAAVVGCGGASHRPTVSSAKRAPPPAPPVIRGPAFGITEGNANLLWNPAAAAPAAAAPFIHARRELTALHPRYVRLLVDWAVLQPSPQNPPALSAPATGCARDVGPCGAYVGIADELAAIATQQSAARAEGRPAFEVVLDILGAPAWAALPPHGCEQAAVASTARPIAPGALAGYRALIAALVALGRKEGVALAWWSPWNEPNDPRFLSPQREACGPDGAPAATAVYAQLARAMSSELKAVAPGARMLLGELGGYSSGSSHRLSIEQFVGALPADVVCLSDTWAVHAYAARGRRTPPPDPVAALETALDARGCAAPARLWVTEAGSGAPNPGRPRTDGAGEERDACRALAAQALAWRSDPRVGAILQYEFRDDPAFPVGLASADLSRVSSVYRMWLALNRSAESASATSTPSALCPG